MKFTQKIALLVCAFGFAIGATGAPVNAKTAAAAVKGWLQFDQKPLKVSLGIKVGSVETYNDNSGVPAYYIVNLEPSGFVIVSADDQVEPIIAFVEKGRFDPSPQNPLGALISKDVPARVAKARAQSRSPLLQASSSKWQQLVQKSSGGMQPKGVGVGGSIGISDLRVAPFIQTLWDQGDLYTTVTNMIWVTNTVVVTTHFASLPLGDLVSTNVAFTNMGETMIITNGPGNPVNYGFGGLSANLNLTNGPDSFVTNSISVTVYIPITFTNEFGQVIADQVLVGNKTISDTANGAIDSSVTHQFLVAVGIPMVVSDAKACYNYFTPPHEPRNKDNYVCGCVATAMAQLMYYFQSPATGVGTTCFQVTVDGGAASIGRNLRGGDGLGGPYDWNAMPLASDYYSLTPPQAQAVGALTMDAGAAVHMQYSASGSSSYLTDAKTALVDTFKYNNAIVNTITNLNTGCFECSLYTMMNPNLDARLPVILGITGDPGGHAIVADGYGYCFGALYHHLNMGWSGAYNAWYQLPIIDMYDSTTASYFYFWDVTQCIFNVFTNGTGEIISGRVLDTNGIPVANAQVSAYSTKGGFFAGATDPNGIYALTGVPSDSTCIITVTNDGYFSVTSNVVTHRSYDNGAECGNVWGANFTLIPAQGPPVFVSQPTDQFVTVGSNATFTASATGQLPLTYQWQYQPSGSLTWLDVVDGEIYHGSQTPTFSIYPTDLTNNGAPFRCIASNSLGSTNSEQHTLSVSATPFISLGTLAGLPLTSGSSNGTNNSALFFNPHGIAVDSQTNVFVADTFNHVIRKLKPSGTNWIVSTIAGRAGNYGKANGVGTNAQFNGPFGIAVDGNGNVFVADTGNSTIRKVSPQGNNWVVTTISGQAGVRGSTDGISALFNFPMGIALDSSGNIFVADEGNHDIRKLSLAGSTWVASTIAGSGNYGSNDGTNNSAQFGQPYGITVNSSGTVFVADEYNHTIRQLKPSGANWVVTTIAGNSGSYGAADGIGASARFKFPTGIAYGMDGSLYVADNGNNTIRRLTLLGTNWNVFTAGGLAGSTGSVDGLGSQIRLNGPFGIALDSHTNIYVSDSLNHTIRGMAATPITGFSVSLTKPSPSSPFLVTWNAVMNQTYQLQYKTNMGQVDWINYATVTASNWTGKISVPVGAEPQRFYRVIPSP